VRVDPPCPDPRFGDYQTNALIALAKEHQLNPRAFATEIAAALDLGEVVRTRGSGDPLANAQAKGSPATRGWLRARAATTGRPRWRPPIAAGGAIERSRRGH